MCIRDSTNGYRYLFGSATGDPARLAELERIFERAGIRARLEADIVRRVWDKFAFISTVATSTSGLVGSEMCIRDRIPADTTTSMQRDFRTGRTTELESLTGYVVREGRRLGVPTPTYDRMYESLRGR